MGQRSSLKNWVIFKEDEHTMNKLERVQTVMRGETPDVTPAGFWFHYPSTFTAVEMAQAHLELYRHTDQDVIKMMQDYAYPVTGEVKNPEDWYHVKLEGTSSPQFRKLAEVIERVKDGSHGEALLFQTMFSPFKAAVNQFSDALVMAHARENPKALLAGITTLAEGLAEWADAYLNLGADGLYFSAQFGEKGRFSKEEWETLVKSSDLRVLRVADDRADKYTIVHICGEPEYDFKTNVDWFTDYPGDLINWSVKDNGCSLEAGREFFQRGILGGLNNKGNLISGTDAEITAEVTSVIDRFGQKGLMIGADCTVQGKIDEDRIRTAVEAAHNYRK